MQYLTMMLPSRLGCPLSLKTANMGKSRPTTLVRLQSNGDVRDTLGLDRITELLAERFAGGNATNRAVEQDEC